MTEDNGKDTELSAEEQVDKIIEAADKLGVEVDETDATQWLTSMAAAQAAPGDFAVDAQSGIFGHRITLLDFDPQVLERYRHIADIFSVFKKSLEKGNVVCRKTALPRRPLGRFVGQP